MADIVNQRATHSHTWTNSSTHSYAKNAFATLFSLDLPNERCWRRRKVYLLALARFLMRWKAAMMTRVTVVEEDVQRRTGRGVMVAGVVVGAEADQVHGQGRGQERVPRRVPAMSLVVRRDLVRVHLIVRGVGVSLQTGSRSLQKPTTRMWRRTRCN